MRFEQGEKEAPCGRRRVRAVQSSGPPGCLLVNRRAAVTAAEEGAGVAAGTMTGK